MMAGISTTFLKFVKSTQKPVSAAFHRILDQAVELAVFCKPSIGFNVMVFIVVAIAVASMLVTAAIVQQQTQ